MTKKKTSGSLWDRKIVWVIIAVLSSALLWVYVTMTEGDLVPETFSVSTVFIGADTLREKNDLIITDISTNTVSVTLRGTRREIANLKSEDITAVIDLTKITAPTEGRRTEVATITFAPGTSTTTISTNNISISPSTISFSLVKQYTVTVPLKGLFSGTVVEGFTPKAMTFDPETVTISGPKSEISKVSYALVEIDRKDIDRTLNFDSTYTLMDSDDHEVSIGNIRLSSETVKVTLPVSATKEVPITVDYVEGAGANSQNVQITCDPATITIAGDAEVLEGISKISVATIDLSSFPLTFEQSFPVVLDNEVTSVTGVTEVKVTVQVIGLETKKFTVTNISVANVTNGYTAEVLTESVEVTLRGPANVLSEIRANNIRIVADVTELGAVTGEFESASRVYVDGFTGVGAIGTYPIFVKIR